MDIKNNRGSYCGAKLVFYDEKENQVFEGKWIDEKTEDDYEITCLMGACYFFHKSWFLYIGGTKSLKMWGSDEPLLSLKTLLSGGNIRLTKSVKIGHKFRPASPYTTEVSYLIYNKLRSMYMTLPDNLYKQLSDKIQNDNDKIIALKMLERDKDEIEKEKEYYKTIFIRNEKWMYEKFNINIPNKLLSGIIECSPKSIHTIIPSEFFTKYDVNDYVWSGNCFEIYYGLSKYVQPKSFLEIGVRFGFSFLPLMIGSNKLDYCLGYDNEEYGNNSIALDNISKYYKGSAKFEILTLNSHSIKKLPMFFDIISIDGDHSYNGKIQDLELTLGSSRYVIIDDYDYHNDVKQSTNYFVEKYKNVISSTTYVKSFRGTLIIEYK